jgi:hypothetical protein
MSEERKTGEHKTRLILLNLITLAGSEMVKFDFVQRREKPPFHSDKPLPSLPGKPLEIPARRTRRKR